MADGPVDLAKEGMEAPPEAPPVDLGEDLLTGTETPREGGEHPGRDPTEGTSQLPTPQESGPQGETDAGGQDLGGVPEESAGNGAPDPRAASATGTGPQDPEAARGGQMGEGSEDAEAEDAEAAEADVTGEAAADRTPLEDLLAKLQRLEAASQDPGEGSLPASEGEEERGPLLEPPESPVPTGRRSGRRPRGFLSAGEGRGEDALSLLRYEGGVPSEATERIPRGCAEAAAGSRYRRAGPASRGPDGAGAGLRDPAEALRPRGATSSDAAELSWRPPAPGADPAGEPMPTFRAEQNESDLPSSPAFKDAPGPCDPEDLLDGVIFGAKYLGSTQLLSERNPPSGVRMAQAQEAVDRIKAPEGESQPMAEVDLFISTQRIKVLTADAQEAMMDHPLQTISYIADIGSIVVLMARRKGPRRADSAAEKRLYKMVCHVFHSADAPLIAQAIGQAFAVAYQQFLRAGGLEPGQLRPPRCGSEEEEEEIRLATGEEMYNGDLAHFCKQESCKEVIIAKQKGEILGVVIVESGWGSILPTVVVANLMHRGPAERSGRLSIGDRIMSVNGTSLVGLPLPTCQGIIRDVRNHTEVTLSVVHCPPVTTAIVRRPDAKYPLGFCVENGIICSLMRGGIAERGGIRVGHRIIEINGQSVVAMAHERIIQVLQQAVSEVRIKTMPASTYRLLTGQEQPSFL